MSPNAFKQQVTRLLAEISRCYELCEAIRAYRRIGSTHEALDQLQAGLKQSVHRIQNEYNTSRTIIGSRIELGDETSRIALNKAIRDVQTTIHPRLNNIAYRQRESHEPVQPGFRDLSRKLANIEADVLETLYALRRAFESARPQTPRPTTPKQPSKPQLKKDEVIVNLKELDILMQHMKSSWVETTVAGRILYVNAFDDKKTRWDKPEGFIKALPRRPKPSSWEQAERQGRENSWGASRGW